MAHTQKDEALAKKAEELAKRTTARKEAPSGSTLEEKIARASIDVGSFLPDRTNEQANYSYVSADQIASRAGDALAREGVVIIPEITRLDVQISETAKGNSRFFVARVDLRLLVSCGPIEGNERIYVDWASVGVDYSSPDKAVAKSITTGIKYFTMKLLQIGVGNDDGEHESAPARQDQEQKQEAEKNDNDLDAIARQIRDQGSFFKACQRYLDATREDVLSALGGLEPVAWINTQPGRSIRGALQIVLDHTIAKVGD